MPVEFLLAPLSRLISAALDRVDVYHRGAAVVLHGSEGLDQTLNVVALFHIDVMKTHSLKHVALGLASGGPQKVKIVDVSAMVFGNRHFIVVDHDYYPRSQLGSHVQALIGLTTAKRAVANDGNHIPGTALEVACLGETGGQAYRRGCVPEFKYIVHALGRIGVARDIIVAVGIDKGRSAPCEHLVHIALVRHVPRYFVGGRVKHPVQRYRGLHHSKVWAHMPAVAAELQQQCIAAVGGKVLKIASR